MTADKSGEGTRQEGVAGEGFPRGIPNPALRALHGAGYTRLEQLTAVREQDLLALHGMGPKAITLLREALSQRGESFAEPEER